MNFVNATPPAGFPDQVIVQHDPAFCDRNPRDAYYLRVQKESKVAAIRLTSAVTMVDARQISASMGYSPTHYTMPGQGQDFLF